MSSYLDPDDYVPLGETLSYGQKVRVKHSTLECSGDSNSLLVEKTDDGAIRAYCFRCNLGGYKHNPLSKVKRRFETPANGDRDTTTGIGPATGFCASQIYKEKFDGKLKDWPSKRAQLWVTSYGITEEEVEKYGISYHNGLDRVLLPVFDVAGVLCSVQSRKTNPLDPKPKYLTYRKRESVPFFGADGLRVVITEDMLSAIKVSRHCLAMPLLSTNLRDIHIQALKDKGITEFILWLDDDNMIVKRMTLKSKKTLSKLGMCHVLHTNGKDPKDHTDSEIIHILSQFDSGTKV